MSSFPCTQCYEPIDDQAKFCPKCGAQQRGQAVLSPATSPKPSRKWPWILAALLGGFVLVVAFAPPESEERIKARKAECAQAVMSSLGTNISNYSDRQAYQAHVAEKCQGLSMNGKPIIP